MKRRRGTIYPQIDQVLTDRVAYIEFNTVEDA